MEELYICYINYIGKDTDDMNLYEILFTDDPNSFWSADDSFSYKPCGLVNGVEINQDYIKRIIEIKTTVNLDLAQDSLCFSYGDCMDGIIPVCWENIDSLEEYPEEGRLIIHYGETYKEVKEKLDAKGIEIYGTRQHL